MTDPAQKSGMMSGMILGGLAAICTALVAVTHAITEPRIAANQQAYLEQSLQPVLSGLSYDGNLSESTRIVLPPHELPGNSEVPIYRVYADGVPIAALFVVSARDGFSGPIQLLIGIHVDGTITGVRVLDHRETPGLGDLIETGKSDWIKQFENKSLQDPPSAVWAIKRDGGTYDQLTGASITPRAVIKAIKQTLVFFNGHPELVFGTEKET